MRDTNLRPLRPLRPQRSNRLRDEEPKGRVPNSRRATELINDQSLEASGLQSSPEGLNLCDPPRVRGQRSEVRGWSPDVAMGCNMCVVKRPEEQYRILFQVGRRGPAGDKNPHVSRSKLFCPDVPECSTEKPLQSEAKTCPPVAGCRVAHKRPLRVSWWARLSQIFLTSD